MNVETSDLLYGDRTADYDTDPEPIHPDHPDRYTEANRHLRALARLNDRETQVTATFKAEMDLLEERLGDQIGIIERQRSWHQRPLQQLHEAILRDDPKAKTVVLPHGELKVTVPAKPQLTVTDPDVFVAWCQINGRADLLNVTVRPARDALGKAIDILPDAPVTEPGVTQLVHDANGERVPGVVMFLAVPRFRAVPVEAAGTPHIDL